MPFYNNDIIYCLINDSEYFVLNDRNVIDEHLLKLYIQKY